MHIALTVYKEQVPVVQKEDNATHLINRYPVDSVVCTSNLLTLIHWIVLSSHQTTGDRKIYIIQPVVHDLFLAKYSPFDTNYLQ